MDGNARCLWSRECAATVCWACLRGGFHLEQAWFFLRWHNRWIALCTSCTVHPMSFFQTRPAMVATSWRWKSIEHERHRPKGSGLTLIEVLAIIGIVVLLIAMLLPATRSAREAARRNSCNNAFKQLGLSLHNYHDVWKVLPPAYTVDSAGKPLHSWRTLLLPFLEEDPLYQSIDLSKPWNGPVNARIPIADVQVFHCPAFTGVRTQTTCKAVVTPDSCLRPRQSVALADITDGGSQTLTIIEVPVDQAVPWMAPQDASEADLLGIQPDSRTAHTGGFNVGFADGSVRFLRSDTPADIRRALVTIAGREAKELPE